MINITRFGGWIIECPFCESKDYIHEEDIAFDPHDGDIHIIACEKCKKEFELEPF